LVETEAEQGTGAIADGDGARRRAARGEPWTTAAVDDHGLGTKEGGRIDVGERQWWWFGRRDDFDDGSGSVAAKFGSRRCIAQCAGCEPTESVGPVSWASCWRRWTAAEGSGASPPWPCRWRCRWREAGRWRPERGFGRRPGIHVRGAPKRWRGGGRFGLREWVRSATERKQTRVLRL